MFFTLIKHLSFLTNCLLLACWLVFPWLKTWFVTGAAFIILRFYTLYEMIEVGSLVSNIPISIAVRKLCIHNYSSFKILHVYLYRLLYLLPAAIFLLPQIIFCDAFQHLIFHFLQFVNLTIILLSVMSAIINRIFWKRKINLEIDVDSYKA